MCEGVSGQMAHLLFIGADQGLVPVLKEARSLGCTLSVCASDSDAPGLVLADTVQILDVHDDAACQQFAFNQQPDGIIASYHTAPQKQASRLASALDLAGLSRSAAGLVYNDLARRDCLTASGLAIADYQVCSHIEELGKAYRCLGPDVYIRPVQPRYGRAVTRVSDLSRMVDAFRQAKADSLSGEILIETAIPGDLVRIEGYVSHGRVEILTIADIEPVVLDGMSLTQAIIPSLRPALQIEEIITTSRNAVLSLGLDHTSFCIDLVMNSRSPVITDIRPHGSHADMFFRLVPSVTEVNTPALVIDLSLGFPVSATPCLESAAILTTGLFDPSGLDHREFSPAFAYRDADSELGRLGFVAETAEAARKQFSLAWSQIHTDVQTAPASGA